jgi:hypothetical protein
LSFGHFVCPEAAQRRLVSTSNDWRAKKAAQTPAEINPDLGTRPLASPMANVYALNPK